MAEPMYRQIAEDLRRKIESGGLAPGSMLPSEIELREQYMVSRNTLRDAMKWLTTRGLIVTRPGVGTFVAEKFTRFTVRLGAGLDGERALYLPELPSGHGFESSIPRVEVQRAEGAVREELELPEDEQVVSRHQQRFVDSVPWSLQTSYYPMNLVQAGATRLLAAEDIWNGTIPYLADTLAIKQAGWRERLAVRMPDAEEMAFFRLPDSGLIAVIESIRIAYDEKSRPFRVTVTTFPAERNEFVIHVGQVPVARALREQADAEPGTASGDAADDRVAAAVAVER